ncbi:MAG: hypothetical protein ACI9YR_002373 [Bacteroidia bacterium]|jgi:hypothetical protein
MTHHINRYAKNSAVSIPAANFDAGRLGTYGTNLLGRKATAYL